MKRKEIRMLMSLLLLLSLGSLLVQYNLMRTKETGAHVTTQGVFDGLGTEEEFTNKWIIVAAINSSTEIHIPGWTVLLYGDLNNRQCRFPHCVQPSPWKLSPEWNDHAGINSKRISAYMYAISNGAAFICNLEVWNDDIENILRRFSYDETTSGMVPLTNVTFVQPESLYSRVSANRSEHVLSKPENMFFRFVIDEHSTPGIHIGVPIAPDTTYLSDSNQLPLIFLPAETYTSLTSPVILFRYEAFWALGLMEFGSGVWDAIVQKLLWSQSLTVGVFPLFPNDVKPRKRQVDGKADPTLLKDWDCELQLMHDCMVQLIEICRNETLISDEELNIATLFFDELVSIKYHMYLHMLTFVPKKPYILSEVTNGIFRLPGNVLPDSNVSNERLREVCPDATINFSRQIITDIALIVTFNYVSLYKNFALIEAMYRPYFRHIIFCAHKIDIIAKHVSSTIGYIIFIDSFPLGWWTFQMCITEAMKLNLGVEGFLQIGDDAILNPWHLYDLPRDTIWLTNGTKKLPFSLLQMKNGWQFWKSGKDRFLNLFRKMELNSGDIRNKRFLEQFGNNSEGFKYMFISGCDFMYVPVKFKEEFSYLSTLFIDNRLIIEIAYPNMAMGIIGMENLHFLEDGSLWRKNRLLWAERYNENLIFMHPFKLIKYLESDEGKRIFCNFMNHK